VVKLNSKNPRNPPIKVQLILALDPWFYPSSREFSYEFFEHFPDCYIKNGPNGFIKALLKWKELNVKS
jgi:hypothetical protein